VNGDANGHYTCATCSTKNFINIDRKMLKKLQANSLNSPQPVELMLNPDTAACPRPDLPKDKTVELRTSCQNCKKDIQRTFHLVSFLFNETLDILNLSI
jgi:ribosomal protein L44E